MSCITVANMREGVLLHKLILLELLLATAHGTFCFMDFNGYSWYLSSTASLLYCSWVVHNIVAWIKIRPFFFGMGSFFQPKVGKYVQWVYLVTLAMTIPPIILQIFDNFRFFNNINDLYKRVRPYEPLMRDPWWIFTNVVLLHVIRKSYGASVFNLIGQSPRLGILLAAICLAITFTIMDILSSVIGSLSTVDGINPYWKLSLVFKCLTDTIMLDDFKTELRKLGFARLERDEARRKSNALVTKDSFAGRHDEVENVGPANGHAQNMSLGEMLTSDDQLESQLSIHQDRRKSSTRVALGKVGTKISKLPSLGQNNDPWLKSKDKEKV